MPHSSTTQRRKEWLLQNRHLWEKGLIGRAEELEFARTMVEAGLFSPKHLYAIDVRKVLTLQLTCRVPSCTTEKLHSHGLCNLHRKWVDRGAMTLDLQIIREPLRRGLYKQPGAKCRIPNCDLVPRRYWLCAGHASQVRRGTIDLEGKPISKDGKIFGGYPADYPCKVCKRTGKISMGFCSTHYNQYINGKRSLDGTSKIRTCKAIDCNRRLVRKDRDWCCRHVDSFKRGVYNSFGKRMKPAVILNKGQRCIICSSPSHCRGLCRLHYSRSQSSYKGPAARKNKGKQCGVPGCSKPASCKGMCPVHYLESRLHISVKLKMVREEGYTFKELVDWTCNKDGQCLEIGFGTMNDAINWAYIRVRKEKPFPLWDYIRNGGYISSTEE